MSSLQIGKAIYSILSNDDEVKTKVNDRIYPVIADFETKKDGSLNVQFPFIIYRRSGIENANNKDYINENDYIEFAVVDNNYPGSIQLAEAVRKSLEGKRLDYDGISISNIILSNATEDYIENSFTQILTFRIILS